MGISTDVRFGFVRSNFDPVGSESSRTDTFIGLNWRINDEFIRDGQPALTFRAAATIAGNYATDQVNSIGNGVSGFAPSLMIGKILSPKIVLAADCSRLTHLIYVSIGN